MVFSEMAAPGSWWGNGNGIHVSGGDLPIFSGSAFPLEWPGSWDPKPDAVSPPQIPLPRSCLKHTSTLPGHDVVGSV